MAFNNEGFALEITADVKGLNAKLAEARKELEKLQKEAANIKIGGSAVGAAGSGNTSSITAQRKFTTSVYAMGAALDSAVRSLARFNASLTAGTARAVSASSMQTAVYSASSRVRAAPVTDSAMYLPSAAMWRNHQEQLKKAKEEAKVVAQRERSLASVSMMGMVPTAAILGGIAAAPLYKGFSEFGEREKLRTDLGTLLGSDQKGASFAGRILDYAASTPYSQKDLAGTAKLLLQYGTSENDTEKYMKQLGDIAMGNGQQMSSLGLVLGQVKSAGALKGQDLMQFINAGWNPLSVLSEMTGKTMGELKEMASDGAITFDLVAKALEKATSEGGQFYKGAERGAKTLKGLTSTIEDNIGTALNDIVASQEGAIKDLATKWANFDWSKIVKAGSDFFKLTIDGFGMLSDIMMAAASHSELLKQVFMGLESTAVAMAGYKLVENIQHFNEGLAEAAKNMGESTSKFEAFSKSAAGTQIAIAGIVWGLEQIIRFFSVLPEVFTSAKDAKKMRAEIAQRSKILDSVSMAYDNFRASGNAERYKTVYDLAKKNGVDLTGSIYDIWGKPDQEKKSSRQEAKRSQMVVIDKSKKEVKQTNNIKVDESRFAKVVKENLEMLLSSQLRLDNDLTSVQATAG